MTDLTAALANQEFFDRPEFNPELWTDAKLRDLLDIHGIEYEIAKNARFDGGIKYNLATCPRCGKSEGNPAVWRQDGIPHYKCFREKSGCADFTFQDWLALLRRPSLTRVNAKELVAKFLKARVDVVVNLIRRGM